MFQQKKPPSQTEEFADFSRFNNEKTEEISSKQIMNPATSESSRSRAATGTTDSSDEIVRPLSDEEHDVKPTPAPRHNRKCPILLPLVSIRSTPML